MSTSKIIALIALLSPNIASINKAITELPTLEQSPRMVTMSLSEDTKTQMAFNWNTTWKTNTTLQVVIKTNGDFSSSNVLEFTGYSTKSLVHNDGFIHKVVATNLSANTTYQYRVGDKELNNWSDVGEFTTAGDVNSTRFIHISDPQGYEEVHYDAYQELLAAAVNKSNPDFFMLSGDIVNDSYQNATPKLQQWEWALTKQKNIMQNIPFMTTPGNHDAASNDYNSRFNHPVPEGGYSESGSYYSFNYQGSHFISLNTNDTINNESNARGLSSNQFNWLEDDLKKAANYDFIVVMMHKGIYDAGGHCSNNDNTDYDIKPLREQLTPLFTKYNVDLVLQGHDHLYSRSYPLTSNTTNEFIIIADKEANKKEVVFENDSINIYENPKGTIYLNSGTASGSKYYQTVPYDSDLIPLETSDSSTNRIFTEITIEDNNLFAKVYKLVNGQTILFDSFGIKKNLSMHNNNQKNNFDLSLIVSIICGTLVVAGCAIIIIKNKNKKGDAK